MCDLMVSPEQGPDRAAQEAAAVSYGDVQRRRERQVEAAAFKLIKAVLEQLNVSLLHNTFFLFSIFFHSFIQ